MGTTKNTKLKSQFPQWKGFDISPEGCLLEQRIDLSGEMGFAYERCCQYYKSFHTHDRLMLIFSRGSSVMEVKTRAPQQALRAHADNVLLVPQGLEHDDEGMSAIYDTMALYPSDALLAKVAEKLKISSAGQNEFVGKPVEIRRNKRLALLAEEYFIGRVLTKGPADAEDMEYLARQILAEVLRGLFPSAVLETKPELGVEGSVASKALRFIEANLFEPLELSEIARKAGGSISTLSRRFKAETGMTPYAYIKDRRLEEARRLLERGEHGVGDIALLVGYENFGSFSEAFKEKYGKPPSAFLA